MGLSNGWSKGLTRRQRFLSHFFKQVIDDRIDFNGFRLTLEVEHDAVSEDGVCDRAQIVFADMEPSIENRLDFCAKGSGLVRPRGLLP